MFSETINPGFGGRQRVICATKRSWRSSHSSSLMFTKQGTVYLCKLNQQIALHSIVNDRSNECLRSALWINRTSLVKKRRLSRQTAIMITSFRRRELRSLNLFAF